MSYINMTAYDLRNLCLKVKKSIDMKRKQEIDNYIQGLNRPRWWRKKKYSYEESLEKMKKNSYFLAPYSPYSRMKSIGGRAERVADKLLTATEVSPLVNVSVDDLRMLKDWAE